MFHHASATATATALSLLLSVSSAQLTPLSEFFNITTFPNEQKENVTRYLNEAASHATSGAMHQYFQDQCITQQVYPSLFTQPSGYVKPFAAFDRFYFVGHSGVSAWAYDTGDGLVLIDALDNEDEIKAILLPGLQEFGFKGEDIKHVIITHEHPDHDGGAKYLQDTFPALKTYATKQAWDDMEALEVADPLPQRNETLADGDELRVGNVTFSVVFTPGHTEGTLSLVFPVFDNGVKHIAGLSGGTGTPTDKASREKKIQSQVHFAQVGKEMGVDALISNHNVADHALFHADLLAHRGEDSQNPFVVGAEDFDNYMRINALCSRVVAAREGMSLDI